MSIDAPRALDRTDLRWCAALLVAALAIRLVWVLTVDTGFGAFSDPQWYFVTAKNLAHGDGLTTTKITGLGHVAGPGGAQTLRWPVGYSLSLAVFFKIFGATVITGKIVNAVAGAATVPLVYLVARRIFDRRVAITAGALAVIYPAHVIWSSVLYSDLLFSFAFSAALVVLLYAGARPSWRQALAFGLLLGYAAIIRPTATVLLLPAAIYWLAAAGPRRLPIAPVAIALAGVLLWLAPISAWNSIRTGSPKLISENLGYNLRIGHAPYSTGRYVFPADLWATVPPLTPGDALPNEGLATRRAIRYAATHPLREVELSARKVFYLYTTDSDAMVWASTFGTRPIWDSRALTVRLSDLCALAAYAVLVLAIASMPLTFGRRRELVLLWLTLAVWTATHIVFFGEPRYRLPLLPILLTFAAVSLVQLADLARGPLRARDGEPQDGELVRSPEPMRETGDPQ